MPLDAKQYFSEEEVAYYLEYGIDITSSLFDPKIDLVFKTMFTSEAKESNEALKDFLGSVLSKRVNAAVIRQNEPAVFGLNEKSLKLDIFVTFNDGEDADIEMQMRLVAGFGARIEYNLCKLHSTQEIKGKEYDELKPAYAIVVLANGSLAGSPDLMTEYMYSSPKSGVLPGARTRIILMELAKLDPAKPVEELTASEMWGMFLKFANDPDKKPAIKQIIESREGVRMGAQVLQQISDDRDKRIELYLRMKAEADIESNRLAAARSAYRKAKAESADEINEAKNEAKEAKNEAREAKTKLSEAAKIQAKIRELLKNGEYLSAATLLEENAMIFPE
jgi:predicted transposase/invertase (TIGR01784 family)